MTRIIRMLMAATAAGGLSILGLVSAGAASASTGTGGLSYEVDNGSSWTLSKTPASISTTFQSQGYADAGVVTDIGSAATFGGITFTGTGPVQDNIWIGDDPEAYTPGTHLLSDTVNFSYGFDNHNGTFYMAAGPYASQTLTVTQIRADFSGDEAFAWVGVVYTGPSVSGSVTSINGHSTGNRIASVTQSGGSLTAAVK